MPSWDLGIFTELAQRYANVMVPIVDIKGPNYNLLGDHFHPLLVLLGPIFAFFPSGLTLLVVQNFLFALSTIPLTRFARRRLGTMYGIGVGVAYAISFGLLEAIHSQFHEIAFAVPLLAYGLVSWLEGRRTAAAIELGLLVFVKEDLGLTVFMFGLVEVWRLWGERAARRVEKSAAVDSDGAQSVKKSIVRRPRRTLNDLFTTLSVKSATLPISLMLWGAAWFIAAIFIFLPALNPNGGWDYTGNIGGNTGSDESALAHILEVFTPVEKWLTILLLIATAGVVGIRSPYMWIMLPTLAWRFLGNVVHYWGWHWHYSAILMPIAIVALIDGVKRIGSSRWIREEWLPRLAGFAVVISLITNTFMAFNGSFGTHMRGEDDYYTLSDEEIGVAQGAIEAVGKSRNVVTDLRLLAYLVPDNRVFWEGTVDDGDDVIDTVVSTPASSVMNDDIAPAVWATNRFGGEWDVVYDRDGYTVVKRKN